MGYQLVKANLCDGQKWECASHDDRHRSVQSSPPHRSTVFGANGKEFSNRKAYGKFTCYRTNAGQMTASLRQWYASHLN